jgi:hypothetical protein
MSDTELTYMIIPARLGVASSVSQCSFAEGYNTMRTTVGGYIERVSLELADMYINEDGKMHNLPANVRATWLAWHEQSIAPNDFIVGDAILFGKADEYGNETSITPELRTHIIKVLKGAA